MSSHRVPGLGPRFGALLLALGACAGEEGGAPRPFVAITFNAGTTPGLPHDAPPDDGYTGEMAEIADALYENSLAWNPAEEALTRFLAEHAPDVVAFQEIFHDPWCEDIEVDPSLDFVCRDASPERPLQVQRLVGEGFQVACVPDQDDTCLAVRRSFASFVDCEDDICPLVGFPPPNGCTSRPRLGSAEVQTADGASLVLTVFHGSSGLIGDTPDCRAEQVEQIFVDRGDGQPAAWGEANLAMGDLNTDPFLFAEVDPSAARWNEHVGDGKPFHYVSSSDPDGPETYVTHVRIDQVVSDALAGSCVVAGVSEGTAAPIEAVYWDHHPVICEVEAP